MSNVLVSVIMPAYNAALYIGEAIQSVVNQTHTNWELVIVDDGSTDDTAAEARQIVENDLRIKYIYQPNGKQGKARNTGIKQANGTYIAFLDADDLWIPNTLEVLVKQLSTSADVDMVFAQGYFKNGHDLKNYDTVTKSRWDKSDLKLLCEYNQVPILSVLVKKKALLSVGYFSELSEIQKLEDYHLWLKMMISGYKFQSIPERLFYYRLHGSQSTFGDTHNQFRSFSVYKDLYYAFDDVSSRKVIINRLKWMLFDANLYPGVMQIAQFHFKSKGKKFISSIFESGLLLSQYLMSKLGFQLIKIYG